MSVAECELLAPPPAVQYVHAVLRSALQQAMREELIARNVARIVETPTVTPKEVRPLDGAEARILLKTALTHHREQQERERKSRARSGSRCRASRTG
ncbi:hypothetical protein GCM10023257_24350 [Streptomyces hyderabadensis]|uniref:Uncharacterized protein n=2 Tax=Streptomyces hyderabadensis TaxID=598549 RepID=A0ABP9I0T0_9ACTN